MTFGISGLKSLIRELNRLAPECGELRVTTDGVICDLGLSHEVWIDGTFRDVSENPVFEVGPKWMFPKGLQTATLDRVGVIEVLDEDARVAPWELMQAWSEKVVDPFRMHRDGILWVGTETRPAGHGVEFHFDGSIDNSVPSREHGPEDVVALIEGFGWRDGPDAPARVQILSKPQGYLLRFNTEWSQIIGTVRQSVRTFLSLRRAGGGLPVPNRGRIGPTWVWYNC